MLDKLHEISYERIQRLIIKVNSKLRLPKKVKLAIDFTEKEYYGDKRHPAVMGSKEGKYVRMYIEVSTVKPALFINAFPVNQFTNNKKKLLKQLLDGFHRLYEKTKIDLLLLDRGFFTKAVIAFLIRNKIPFVMPAVKNKAIKSLAEQFRKGWLPDRIKYEFGKYEINLLFLKVKDDILVYATNTRKSPKGAHTLYRNRWQIETNFREQNNFVFQTKTRNFAVRYLAFALGGLLFNAWQLTRDKTIYKMESHLYKHFLKEEVLKLWQEFASEEIIKSLE